MNIYLELITELKDSNFTEKQLARKKRELASQRRLKTIPTNIQVLLNAEEKDLPWLKPKLITKPVRTISGGSPIAIMTKPDKCPHGKCIFCPGGLNSPWGDVPQSYRGKDPATRRGIKNNYTSYPQVMNRLKQYFILGHSFDKIELIFM